MIHPSGRQEDLRHGAWAATVVEVGGGLRTLSHDGHALLDGYEATAMADGGRGQPLMPWPNRLAGGAYEHEGRRIQAPLSEPARGNAIHGLVRWSNWTTIERSIDACTMALRLHPQPAYPFALDLRIAYALGDDGLTVSLSALNIGPEAAPFGAGFHPYLLVGADRVDEVVLTLPASVWLPGDERAIPTGERRAVDGELDFRSPRQVGPAVIDHCFGGLERGPDGWAVVALEGPAGRASLWMDRAFDYVMVFTGDTLAPERRRRGLAVEPMTCAPDAFNSGEGLRVLAPGEAFGARWGIIRTPAP